MNLPNKLTIFRVILIPFFVVALMLGQDSLTIRIVAEIIFCVASLTDMLDGKIARKYNLITDFGKFMDPLADKLLTCSAFICFIELGQIRAWIVIIIIAREFIISGFRLVAADSGIVIAANMWGKVKTVFQMAATIVLILNLDMAWYQILGDVLVYIALALTVISLVVYIKDNSAVLKETK